MLWYYVWTLLVCDFSLNSLLSLDLTCLCLICCLTLWLCHRFTLICRFGIISLFSCVCFAHSRRTDICLRLQTCCSLKCWWRLNAFFLALHALSIFYRSDAILFDTFRLITLLSNHCKFSLDSLSCAIHPCLISTCLSFIWLWLWYDCTYSVFHIAIVLAALSISCCLACLSHCTLGSYRLNLRVSCIALRSDRFSACLSCCGSLLILGRRCCILSNWLL